MSFSGKATYSSGSTLLEIAEDVSDIISIVSPYETPLLEMLGDPLYNATSTRHEWLEDSLLPNTGTINDSSWTDASADTSFIVDDGTCFRIGDQIKAEGSLELMVITNVSGNILTVQRGYAGTTAEDLTDNQVLHILGNLAYEGADKPAARFTNRIRKSNYTQIFTSSVEVSGSDLAARQLGLADELDYQKQERLRELLRDLENTVINGGMAATDPQGSSNVARSMNGIINSIQTNIFKAGQSGFPAGTSLSENQINYALRKIWEASNSNIDLIVVNGYQKRMINSFMYGLRSYGPKDSTFSNMVDIYESDFGVCKIIPTRWMPKDSVLLLDSSRISVLPLSGRSFHYKPLPSGGDYECGQIIGEYTLEFRNEEAHGVITDMSVA
ncbi:MAG: DUF5309 family protein [Phycisphaerae bacterium]|nr:DUF5309 family protein [Phycisphaerae bacterium]